MEKNIPYVVVVNEEEQYSIWNSLLEVPVGWKPVTSPKSEEECIEYIDQHWTDIRPKSLREALESIAE